MSAAQDWNAFFSNWPKALPRRGVLQTVLNETMPYREFWLKDCMLLIERTTPDAMGARFVMISFDAISSVKFTDPLTSDIIADAGFKTKLAQREPQLA